MAVFCRPSEKFRDDLVNVQEHVKASFTITFWGGIALGNKTLLIVMKRDPDAKNNWFTA